jgi:cytochrome c-type biogenesis protein CcmH
MALFVILGLMTVVAMALLVLPLVRGYGAMTPRADYDLEIYRDQLDEIERDVERGVIDADERASARIEIERRMLAASPGDPDMSDPDMAVPDPGKSGILAGFAIMMLVPLAAGSLYLGLGSPGIVDQPFAERPVAGPRTPPMDGNPDVEAMVASLAERLEAEPDDLEGWLMLGRSYGVLGRYIEAVDALERARKLDGQDPDIIASLAENRVFATDGVVNPAAIADFEALRRIEPDHPAARFYLGLSHAQSGEYQIALDEWIDLARESPADAPWMEILINQITDVSETLGVPLPDGLNGIPVTAMAAPGAPSAPGPTSEDIAAAQSMSADEQSTMIRSMVARLAARLEDEPEDIEGWRRLANAYGVLGENDLAIDAYASAAAQTPTDIALLSELAESITRSVSNDTPLPPQAVTVFRQILALDEQSPVALWHLGLAAAETGSGDEARGYWSRLLALIPADSSDRDAVQRALDSL